MGRMPLALAAGSLALLAPAAVAQVLINPSNGKVSIRAAGQSVSSLLDQLARQTGMKVEYEKSPPSQSVTLSLDDRTAPQAIVALLDGLNIPYALSLSPDGHSVQTLVIADVSPPPAASRGRVGREAFSPQAPDPANDVPPPDQAPLEAAPDEAKIPDPSASKRGAPAPPPPVTLPSAFPNSPFGDDNGVEEKPEDPAETTPQIPQSEKPPDV
jgi:hypothetical protein